MQILIVLAFLARAALCRVASNLGIDSSNEELSLGTIKQIQQLIDFTKRVDESQEPVPESLPGTITVGEKYIKFYIYNRNDRNGEQISLFEARHITNLTSFDTNLDTVFTVHGWNNEYNSTFNTIIDTGLLEIKDVNVISVDWDAFANLDYILAHCAVPFVGNFVGEFIRNISEAYNYPLHRFSMIGHSLGAHVCGYAGKSTNGSLSSITALDPAGPLYSKSRPNRRLNVGDALYVQVIHTDALFLGLNYHIGDVDYWPNGGFSQPGCNLSFGMCSHSRSYYYFHESLASDNFISTECDSFEHYEAGRCKNNPVACMGGPTINKTAPGDYYLITNTCSPFAVG